MLAGLEYDRRVGIDKTEAGDWLDARGNGFGGLRIGTRTHTGGGGHIIDQQHHNDDGNYEGKQYGYD